MKNRTLLSIALSAAAFAAGCGNEQTPSLPSDSAQTESTAEALDKVKAKAKETAKDVMDYTYAQKAQFAENLEARVTALNKELDLLSTRIEQANDEFKAQAKPKLQALRDQTAQLKTQLDQVKNANESTWDSVKTSAEKAYEGLKDGVRDARQWVSDKIAP